ncbi:MAG: rhodanese-like domain-containing protein [Niabella sp.]
MQRLPIAAFKEYINTNFILDVRDSDVFKEAFIPGSIHIPLRKLAEWGSVLLSPDEPVLLVAEEGKEAQAAEAISLLGCKNITGYLDGGFDAWLRAGEPIDMIIDVEPDELMMDIPFDDNLVVVDVRQPVEFAEGHLKDAVNMPLNDITDPVRMAQFEEADNIYLHCGGGSRSVIAASLLKKNGIHNLHHIAGGWAGIKNEPRAQIVKEPDVLN